MSSDFSNRPRHEKPRERLAFWGAEKLSDEELLSLVFGSGGTLPIARMILNQNGGVLGLNRLGFFELCKIPHIGPARASQLKAALEIGKRALATTSIDGLAIVSASDMAHFLQIEIGGYEQETFHVFGLDSRHRIRHRHVVAIGQVDRVHIHLSDVFRPLIREGFAVALVAHNHPSGDPRPSLADEELTLKLQEIGGLLGIRLLDHVIISRSGYFSFVEHGFLGIGNPI